LVCDGWLVAVTSTFVMPTVVAAIASLYRCRDLFIDAVLNCEELEIVFPKEQKNLSNWLPALNAKAQRA